MLMIMQSEWTSIGGIVVRLVRNSTPMSSKEVFFHVGTVLPDAYCVLVSVGQQYHVVVSSYFPKFSTY